MSLPTCEAKLPLEREGRVLGLIYCDDIADALYRWACVHEHIKEQWTCSEHAPSPGEVGCFECLSAGHECPTVGEFVRKAFADV